ncbi:MAG: hypothetical protein M3545_11000 [Acidobacteriota bacterium]|nr:hypothetical protein [Acidobacteriota bacterium]
MNTLLIGVAGLSLALAVGMAIVIARLLREDRERSEARVAALAALAADPVPSHRNTTPALPDLELRPDADDGGEAGMFARHDEPSPWGRRAAIAGVLAVVVGAALFAASQGSAPASGAARSDGPPAPPVVRPLELRALRHSLEPQGLTISGLVQNPASGAPLSRLVATAIVFGPAGDFLTSSRAPLDLSTLAPGDESPFVISVPVEGNVSRYRIGFRTEAGAVVAHVDRRTPDALASRQGQP